MGEAQTVKILVASHKPYWMPSDPLYQPVQVGAAQHEHLEGFAHDDEGDNISEILHDAYNGFITAFITAYGTDFCICEITAYFAVTDILMSLNDGL